MKYIQDFKQDQPIRGIYLCKNKRLQVTKTDKSYYTVVLQDKTGTIEGKIWDINSSAIYEFDTLDYVEIDGFVTLFNENLQLKINRLRVAEEGTYDLADYCPESDRDVDEMYEELKSYIATIQNPYLHQLLQMIFLESAAVEKQFKRHSAAKTVHHGFMGGLLEHTLGVVTMCDFMAQQYTILNRDLLLTAAMLHDIGKLKELSEFPSNDYTDSGQLLGHIVMGVEMVGQCIRKIENFPQVLGNELKHCIVAHHGEFEYGSPKKPALAEAMALNFADNIDAKMETLKELFAGSNAAPGEWLGYNRLLESNIRQSSLNQPLK